MEITLSSFGRYGEVTYTQGGFLFTSVPGYIRARPGIIYRFTTPDMDTKSYEESEVEQWLAR